MDKEHRGLRITNNNSVEITSSFKTCGKNCTVVKTEYPKNTIGSKYLLIQDSVTE